MKYKERIPTSFGGTYRKPISTPTIQNLLISEFGANEKQLGAFAKHHTNKIKEEIINEFKN